MTIVRRHLRRSGKKKIRVKSHRRKVRRKKKIPKINKPYRKIFNHLSDLDRHNIEFGGAIDFKKNGTIERMEVESGTFNEIYLPDFEVLYHTHISHYPSYPSSEDIYSFIRNENQQIEIVFNDGDAYIIKKGPKVKNLKKIPAKKLRRIISVLQKTSSRKEYLGMLEDLGFKVKFRPRSEGSIKLNIKPVD